MPNTPSTQVFTHIAIIEKEDKNFPLTKEQADNLRTLLKDTGPTKYITIPDPNDPFGEPMWEGRAGKVTINTRKIENTGTRWICEFANRHTLYEKCNCSNTYHLSPVIFESTMFRMFPNKYSSTLTRGEQNQIFTFLKCSH